MDSIVIRISIPRSEEPRLNSSHGSISYAVFCLKKKKKNIRHYIMKKKKKTKKKIKNYINRDIVIYPMFFKVLNLYNIFMYTDLSLLFFFNDTATTEIYTLSLHDALPI